MASYDLTALSTPLEFDTSNGTQPFLLRWDDTHIIAMWAGGAGSAGLIQSFSVNAGTGAITAIGTPLSITGSADLTYVHSLVVFDSTHIVGCWQNGSDSNVETRVFAIDGSFIITAVGAIKVVTSITAMPMITLLDSTHLVVVGQGSASDGYAITLAVNTSTWAITEPSSALEFDTANCRYPKVLTVDTTHVLVVWSSENGTGVEAQILIVNGSTWAITAADSPLVVGTTGDSYNQDVVQLDSTHFMVSFIDSGSDGDARVITVNLSTWAVTAEGTAYEYYTGSTNYWQPLVFVNATHAIVVWQADQDGYAVALEANGSWQISKPNTALKFYDSTSTAFSWPASCKLTTYRMVIAWTGIGADGFMQALDITQPAAGPTNLKTYNTNAKANIKTINTNPIANVKTLDTNA